MLRLTRSAYDEVVAHARRDHPDEACGVLPGRDGEVTRVVPMTNAQRSPTGFELDGGELLRLTRAMDDADEELLVLYHSHTMTEAAPSRTDVRFAADLPGTHWLLISTRDPAAAEVRAFTIDDGAVTEEELVVLDG